MTPSFTTAGLGIVPGGDGDVDYVVPRQAWLNAHEGGTIAREDSSCPGWTARWPDGTVAATAFAGLGHLMAGLNRAEDARRCPVHGSSS
jgi:hypothetical protein